MCGFSGIVGKDIFSDSKLTSKFNELKELSYKRGPDDQHSEFFDHCFLHFNRLSILDLSIQGRQPKRTPNQEWAMVFNGEVYNHLEIRQKLLPNTDYKSHSDSETILHAIEQWGFDACIQQLNGMFAIAAYHFPTNQLFLARDFVGIKPLYYGLFESKIGFSSQFDQTALLIQSQEALKINPEGMRDYIQLGYMHPPSTIYHNIFQVLPGEIIQFSIDGKIEKRRYYLLEKDSKVQYDEDNLEQLESILHNSVQSQMLSDVPLGSFLSSGIDSTLVTGFASKINHNIKSFTCGMKDFEGDEREKAAEYSSILGVENIAEEISFDQLLDTIDQAIEAQTEPFGDFSSVPTYLITKVARKHNIVVLSGDGGDELFWGYPRWQRLVQYHSSFSLPILARRLIWKAKNIMGAKTPPHGIFEFEKISDWVLNAHSLNNIHTMNSLMGKYSNSEGVKDIYQYSQQKDKKKFRNWLRWNEFYGHLQRVLVKVDRMSMANSIEVRVPFLDKNVIEYAWSLDSEFGISHNTTKKNLKSLLLKFIPKEKINHKKLGFSAPIDEWLHGPLKEKVYDALLNNPIYGSEYLNEVFLKQYVTDYFKGKNNNSWGIWILYNWQVWGKKMEKHQHNI